MCPRSSGNTLSLKRVIKGRSHILHFFFFGSYGRITIPYLLDVDNETRQSLLHPLQVAVWRGRAWVATSAHPCCREREPVCWDGYPRSQNPQRWQWAEPWVTFPGHRVWMEIKPYCATSLRSGDCLSLQHNETALNVMPPNQVWNKHSSTPHTCLGEGKGGNSLLFFACLPGL